MWSVLEFPLEPPNRMQLTVPVKDHHPPPSRVLSDLQSSLPFISDPAHGCDPASAWRPRASQEPEVTSAPAAVTPFQLACERVGVLPPPGLQDPVGLREPQKIPRTGAWGQPSRTSEMGKPRAQPHSELGVSCRGLEFPQRAVGFDSMPDF